MGVITTQPDAAGLVALTLWDGRRTKVQPSLSDDDIRGRCELDRLVRAHPIEIYSTVHLDGPLAATTGYTARDTIGYRMDVALPPRPGGAIVSYEIVQLSGYGEPAHARPVDGAQGGAVDRLYRRPAAPAAPAEDPKSG